MSIDVSVLIPVYNEQGNILPCQQNIVSALEKIKTSYEIIYIDDGSTDRTFNELKEMHGRFKRTKIIRNIM